MSSFPTTARRVSALATVALAGVLASCSQPAQEKYVAELSAANEVPSNTSTAVGRVVLLVNREGTGAEYSVQVDGLSAGIQGAHFHRGAVGANGPIVLSMFFNSSGVATNAVTPGTTDLEINKAIGRTVTKDQLDAFITDLRAGNIYANVHTPTRPGGEVRGQMVRQ